MEKLKGMASLHVQSVQALAADCNGSSDIPERYIRPEAEADPVISDGDLEIPIIDMGKLLDPDSSAQESARLHLACQDWGFFQVINHNIPSDIVESVKVDTADFFMLPLEEKKASSPLPGSVEGYGQLFVFSEDQKLDWADMIYFNTQPLERRRIDLWPSQPHTFRHTIDRYSSEIYSLARVLLSIMVKNLGVNTEVMNNVFKDITQSVRINYYPPCHQPDKALGLSPHSDGSLITLVYQLNQVPGLQVKKNGAWVPVKPLPGAFIVNIGDSLEIYSNGIYKSIEHRVMVNKEKDRLSIAVFHSSNSDSLICPFEDIVRVNKANYRTISHEDYRKLYMSSKLEGKSCLDGMKFDI